MLWIFNKDFEGPSNRICKILCNINISYNNMQNQTGRYFKIYGLNILNFIDFPLGYKFEVKI